MLIANILIFLVTIDNLKEAHVIQNDYVTVKTSLGLIKGLKMKSRENKDFLAFRGIKYAESPTGENRFREPIPIKNWTGVYDATKDGTYCQQTSYLVNASSMSEDCLILNVYTQNLSGNKSVLVYIHGGSYILGGSHSTNVVGPHYLMDKDIVLVSLNYRLGAFGFLSTATKDSPGNYAFKDQVLALRWVRDHIKSFGGNPNAVTIFGQSAGGFSVTLHMISPMSQGLFNRVIAMSGAEANHDVIDNRHWTKKLGEAFSCDVDSPKLLVECLRKIPADEIINVCDLWEGSMHLNMKWSYEIEEDFGQERFLTEHPIQSLFKGDFMKVPILTGITKDELGPAAYFIYYNKPEVIQEFNENFNEIAPQIFTYEQGTEKSLNISRALRKFYLNNKKIDERNLDKFGELIADGFISHGVHRFVELTRKYTDVYYYRTDFVGRYSHMNDLEGKPIGVCHSDDRAYLFVYDKFAPMFKKTDPENIMVERYTTWWTTFAKNGNPNDDTNEYTSSIKWNPSNATVLRTLYIDTECTEDTEPYQDRLRVWDELFPIPYQ